MSFKYLIKIAISLLLTGSILGPTLVSLANQVDEEYVVFELADEENGKETEKKDEEKELFYDSLTNKIKVASVFNSNLKNSKLLKYQAVESEIVSPPPEILFISI